MTGTAIKNGIYLVIDPSMNQSVLLTKLRQALPEKLAAVQIWDNFNGSADTVLIERIVSLCRPYQIPVFINNQWPLLLHTDLDGVHFDTIPNDLEQIKRKVGREIKIGITCGNDLSVVKWAHENALDYVSFCSLFPSSTATSCELVTFETIWEARRLTAMPIFLAGGIKPDNLYLLNGLTYSGIAVVSGIMNAANPADALALYHQTINAQPA